MSKTVATFVQKNWRNLAERWRFISTIQDTNLNAGLKLLTTGTNVTSSIYSSRSGIIRAPIRASLGRSLGPIPYPLRSKNWNLDPIIRDACAGHVLTQNLILVS